MYRGAEAEEKELNDSSTSIPVLRFNNWMAHRWPKEIRLEDWVVVSCETPINWVMLTELLNLYINILQKEKPEERKGKC